jgi:hypothetical protein
MKIFRSYIVWMILVAFSSCMQPVIWEEGEEVIRYVRTVDYDTIEFRGIFDVLMVQDTTAFVKITCGENLISYVRTHQRKGYIEVREDDRMNWTRNYKRTFVEMHFTRIHHICIQKGVRMVTSGPLKSQFLSIWDISGISETDLEINCSGFKLSVCGDNSGIYKISGKADYTCLEPHGSAHFMMGNLLTDSCHIQHKGTGDCQVNVTRVLEGEIVGKGTIQYKNYPGLQVNLIPGKGRVISQP